MGVGVTQEARFGGEPQQCLDHCEGDLFGVGELRGDADGGSLRCPLWVFDEEVVDCDVESGGEGVQVRVHALYPFGIRVCIGPLILDTLVTQTVDHRAERANPLELTI